MKTFLHSGDLGDIILGLPTMRALGGGTLLIGSSTADPRQTTWPREVMTPRTVKFLRELLWVQDYIDEVKYYYGGPVDYDLNKFRYCGLDLYNTNLAYAHAHAFGLVGPEICKEPWLQVPKIPVTYDVVVNRSSRNHGELNYYKAVNNRAIFLGHEEEYDDFTSNYPGMRIRWHRCFEAMEIAQIINSAKLFVGNQSFCYTIAKALGKDIILEEGPLKNCRW